MTDRSRIRSPKNDLHDDLGYEATDDIVPLPMNQTRVTRKFEECRTGKTHPVAQLLIEVNNVQTEQASRILVDQLPDWIDEFARKNADYGDTSNHLGARGQYAELWRKVGKLKRVMWDGKDLNFEQADEILRDLIGHCFLALLFLEDECKPDNKDGE